MRNLEIYQSVQNLKQYMIAESYRGFDPYDTLLSPFFSKPPFNSRLIRFGAQQVCKRIPISLRSFLKVPKELNPVTLGLAVQAHTYLGFTFPEIKPDCDQEIERLIRILLNQRSVGYSGSCWGYPFDWEARYTSIKANVPTSVATGIVTNALFENYKLTLNERLIDICTDACLFVMQDLNKSYDGKGFCYSYSPVDDQYVLNASMKAARLLSQVYSVNGDDKLKAEARTAVEFLIANQKDDGSWPYSNHDARSWSDNYHTGYVLDCLEDYIVNTGDHQYKQALERGYEFYRNRFFENQEIPKFHYNRVHPIDSTAAAQSLLTLSRFGDIELALSVARWYINNMQSKSGGFYFRQHRFYTDKQIFMRWSNAWMLAGLSYLLYKSSTDNITQ